MRIDYNSTNCKEEALVEPLIGLINIIPLRYLCLALQLFGHGLCTTYACDCLTQDVGLSEPKPASARTWA